MIWSLFEYSSLYSCLLSWLQFSNRGLSWQRLQTATPGRFLVKLSFFSSFRHLILTDLFLILPPRLVSYVLCLLSFVFALCSLLFVLWSLLFALCSLLFFPYKNHKLSFPSSPQSLYLKCGAIWASISG